MPAIRYKQGGTTWQGPIDNGKLSTRWGNGWINPTLVNAKTSDNAASGSAAVTNGGYGANPRWVDTGYRGYPAVPSWLGIYGWDYSNVSLQWSAGSGGAPVTAWHLVQTDESGNWLNQVEVSASPWGNFGVSWDTRYQFYVRAKAASGLYSGYQGPLKASIGHPVQYQYGYVNRQRPWQSPNQSGARNKDQPFWATVPSSVALDGIHWRNLHLAYSGAVTPGTNRVVNFVILGVDYGSLNGVYGSIWTGDNRDHPFYGNVGDGSAWGIVPRGTGWSTTSNPQYMLYADGVWLTGTETYANYEIVNTIPEQGNGYW